MRTLRESRGWMLPDVALLLLMLLVTGWVGREQILDTWNRAIAGGDSGYVLLAPLAVVYLVWLRRSRLQYVRYRPSFWGPVIVAAGLLLTAWGFDSDVLIAWQGGIIVAMIGCVVSMTGPGVVRQFAPAFVAMFMMLPMPGRIVQQFSVPLQSLATGLTEEILRFLQADVARLGNQLIVNGTPIAVGETCNGMPMTLTLGLVIFVLVFSLPLRNGARLALLLLSPFIALFCNVLRLVPTSIMFGMDDPAAAELVYSWSGLAMIPIAILMLIGSLRFLNWLDLPITTWRLVTA